MSAMNLAGCVWYDGETTHVCQSMVEDHERCVCSSCGIPFTCGQASRHIERRRRLARELEGGA